MLACYDAQKDTGSAEDPSNSGNETVLECTLWYDGCSCVYQCWSTDEYMLTPPDCDADCGEIPDPEQNCEPIDGVCSWVE